MNIYISHRIYPSPQEESLSLPSIDISHAALEELGYNLDVTVEYTCPSGELKKWEGGSIHSQFNEQEPSLQKNLSFFVERRFAYIFARVGFQGGSGRKYRGDKDFEIFHVEAHGLIAMNRDIQLRDRRL
eukprot:1213679-Amorphochlora_amoeboformis.AAC.2